VALTKIGTDGVKDDAVTSDKVANAINSAIATNTAKTQTTINNNADNRVITGSGTANTLNGESSVVIDANGKLGLGNTSPQRIVDIQQNSTASYNASAQSAADNSLLRIHNPNGTDNTGVNNHTGLEFIVSSGANSIGQVGLVRTGNNQGDMFFKFRTGGSSYGEKLRIQSGGGISFNGDTAAANALDDYEEGTWTPTMTYSGGGGATLTEALGHYTKIGRMVNVILTLTCSAQGGGSGNVFINGLPFQAGSTSGFRINGFVTYATAFNAINSIPVLYYGGSGTVIELLHHGGTGQANSTVNITRNNISNNTTLRANLTYYVD